MYSEFNHISFLGMSNSELFLVKEDQKEIKFDILTRPTLEFPHGCHVTASLDPAELHHQEDDDNDKIEAVKCCEITVSSKELHTPSLGEFEVADDDDGFRTPTSLDHKIPVITQCPPAPRKPQPLPSSTKRKLSSNVRRCLQLDLSKDVESLFSEPLLGDFHRKIKKARRDVDME